MALLLTPLGPPPEWLRHFKAELPDLEVRLWPEVGNREEIEIAAVGSLPHGELALLPKLRMIASLFAGQDLLLGDPRLPDVPIVRTDTAEGSQSMTETVLLHVLRHHRFLPQYHDQQQRRAWKPLPRLRPRDTRVGIMGLGPLGLAAARTLRDYGFDVAGWVRRPREEPGIAIFHGPDQLAAFLARSTIVVNLLPPTPALRDVLNRETFALLPKGASVINLGRGTHVVDADLIAALDSGQLGAATLDVFRQEPLPPESPLWAHPRISVMPHVARRLEIDEIVPRIAENVRRLDAGQPLVNLVDRGLGY
ncbi:MAG: glyoxylate/hydroxypyruvate reductase [Rhodospirillales bacterium]|nr:glyoxylate/hydroxypyruvate reductase [Rhodospirillales bacterium]